jgi:DNA invertase Pin-like site-specific DNA recombinase
VPERSAITAIRPARATRAAEYVRMSTDHQKYSTQNQQDAIAAYAANRGLTIVCTYKDEGKSGLHIERRHALQRLIDDVKARRTDFEFILVYDVSRWGRFQDVDESAYYEYICKEAGIQVLYCAEQFENDGSLASAIHKTLRRGMAGEFSRDLSTKVFAGQCRIVRLGFHKGGPPGYGLRRFLLDDGRIPKMQLERGQQKSLQTDRIILVPGPSAEVGIVRRIFSSFVEDRKSVRLITWGLNELQIPNALGNPWSTQNVVDILTNERYIGNIIFNRTSFKLQQKRVVNPPEMWVRRDGAFDPIVSPETFAAAQRLIDERRRLRSEQQKLSRLKAAEREKERLSEEIRAATNDARRPKPFEERFGSLDTAHRMSAYQPKPPNYLNDPEARIGSIVRSVATAIISGVEARGGRAVTSDDACHVTIESYLRMAIGIAWSSPNGIHGVFWSIRLKREIGSHLTLIIRMDAANEEVQAFYLLPSNDLPSAKRGQLRLSNPVFRDACRFEDLEALTHALASSEPAVPA